jgi:uncharacterized membrane protein YqjE
MHTPAAEEGAPGGVGGAVKRVAEHASALARLELELAQLEVKRKAAALGIGLAFGLAAAVVAVYAVGFLFATIAAALATFLSTWLALLIVTVFLLVVFAILGILAARAVKRGGAPVPKQAIQEAKETTEALKS